MPFLTELAASLAHAEVLDNPFTFAAAAIGLASLLLAGWLTADPHRPPFSLGLALDVVATAVCITFWVLPDVNAHGWAPGAVLFGLSAIITGLRPWLRTRRARADVRGRDTAARPARPVDHALAGDPR